MIPGVFAGAALRSPAPSWSPADLGVSQWLNDDSPVIDAGGGACSQWQDISGNGWHFSQPTSVKRPAITPAGLGGRRIITFGGDEILSAPDAVGLFRNVASGYIFGVYRLGVTDGAPTQRGFYWFARGGSTTSRMVLGASNSVATANTPYFGGRRLDSDAFAGAESSTPRAEEWVMALGVCNYAAREIDLYINGEIDSSVAGAWTSGGNTSDTNGNGVTLGGILSENAYFPGDIAEVFAGVGVPVEADIDRVFGYAAHRWGLATLLPLGHPYKAAPPGQPAPEVEMMWVGAPS